MIDKNQLKDFAINAFAQRLDLFGVSILFRGSILKARVTQGDNQIDLTSGGFTEKIEYKIKLPISVVPVPKLKEQITIIETGQILNITDINLANPERIDQTEHLITAV